MRLVPLATTACGSAHCPTVYLDADNVHDVLIQGYVVPGQRTPEGETIVRIPRDLLLRAVQELPGTSAGQ